MIRRAVKTVTGIRNKLMVVIILFPITLLAITDIPISGAEEPSPSGSVLGPMSTYSDLTALAILAATLIFIVTRMLPNLHDKITAQTAMFVEAIKLMTDKNGDMLTAVLEKNETREEKRDERMREVLAESSKAMVQAATSMASLQTHCTDRLVQLEQKKLAEAKP